MFLNKRFIPILQISQRKLVKTIKFMPKRYLGDPLNAIRIFNLKEASELIITDIDATQSGEIDFDFLKKLSAQAFVPLVYGGGISSIEDVHKLYQIGFDKVLLGTAAFQNPQLIEKIADIYGSQSIICSLDLWQGALGYKIMYKGNSVKYTSCFAEEVIQSFIHRGTGEVLLHFIDRDGTYKGLDHEFIKNITSKVNVSILVCGGTKDLNDMNQALLSGASGVVAGSIFSFYGKHKAVLINYDVNNRS